MTNSKTQTATSNGTSCLGVAFNQFGPYHIARTRALMEEAAGEFQIVAIEFGDRSNGYKWGRSEMPFKLSTICPGEEGEGLGFWRLFFGARRLFGTSRLRVCLLPGYWPKTPLAVLLAARSLRIPTVLMIDSHAGTARRGLIVDWFKKRLLQLFGAALVGGAPQIRHFAALGFPVERMFSGYAAVDNDYFSARASEARNDPESVRANLGLPRRYFLNLGRLIEKKNLATLIQAYVLFLRACPATSTHLVFVGSGELENSLRSLCGELGLKVVDHQSGHRPKQAGGVGPSSDATTSPRANTAAEDGRTPAVHFYGFRQIDENPAFYALADAFVLPSLVEEWGLVINEAMACGIPVVVSERVGCVEDLLEEGWPDLPETAKTEIALSLEKAKLTDRLRKNGFAIDPGSVDALARVLLQLESAPALRQAMGQAGRSIVEKCSCRIFGMNAIVAAKLAMGRAGT